MPYPSIIFMTRSGQSIPRRFGRILPFPALGKVRNYMNFNAYTLCEVM